MKDIFPIVSRLMSTANVKYTPESMLIEGAFAGDLKAVRKAIAIGASVDLIDPYTGLAALHIAVGRNNHAMARLLIEEGNARFFADRFGRWPSVIGIECRIDDTFADYIVAEEAKFIAKSDPLAS